MKFSEREEKGNQKDVLPFVCQYSKRKKKRSGQQHVSGLKIFSMYIHLQDQYKNPGVLASLEILIMRRLLIPERWWHVG